MRVSHDYGLETWRWKFDGVRRLRLTFLPSFFSSSFPLSLSYSDNDLLLVRRAVALLRDPGRSEARREELDWGRICHQNVVVERWT